MKQLISKIYRSFYPLTPIEKYRRMGVEIGKNCKIQFDVVIDFSHYWHIKIGHNVIIAPRVHILAHDASTINHIGYAKLGNVSIGDNTFIGAGSIILPGVSIGKNAIIGAGSIVRKNVPDGEVYAGNPARFIVKTSEYVEKQKNLLEEGPKFSEQYTLRENIDESKKKEMFESVESHGYGFVV